MVTQGGHEKKIRLFDLGRPEAEPLILGGDYPGTTSCKGTVRSLVWDEGQGGVVGISAGEDGFVRWWDLRTLKQTSCLDMGEPVNSMEMVHGGGTLSVTSGKTVHFLDIMGWVRRRPFIVLVHIHAKTDTLFNVANTHPSLSLYHIRSLLPRFTRSNAIGSSSDLRRIHGCEYMTSTPGRNRKSTKVITGQCTVSAIARTEKYMEADRKMVSN